MVLLILQPYITWSGTCLQIICVRQTHWRNMATPWLEHDHRYFVHLTD